MKENQYVWDDSAEYLTSSVVSLDVKVGDKDFPAEKLSGPIRIVVPTATASKADCGSFDAYFFTPTFDLPKMRLTFPPPPPSIEPLSRERSCACATPVFKAFLSCCTP